jgi:nitroreductase
MDLKKAIETRRAYRSFVPVEITPSLVGDLTESLKLAPSCFNNQPWKIVFVYEREALKKLHESLNKGNEWAYSASMIIAMVSNKEADCIVKNREYFLFDTGMATAFLILRATELGLVAHPIAGFDEEKAKEALAIPKETTLITLVMVGKHSATPAPVLSEKQIKDETARPERKPNGDFAFMNHYGN